MGAQTVYTKDPLGLALDRAKAARERAVAWLKANIDKNGKPIDAEIENGWMRVPWALASVGEYDLATRVVNWAENNNQFTAEGDMNRRGDVNDAAVQMQSKLGKAYGLAHYAHGTWLTGQYAISKRTMNVLKAYQDAFGGYSMMTGFSDNCVTCQVGYTALLTGDDEMAEKSYSWLTMMLAQQPGLDKGLFYSGGKDDKLVTTLPEGQETFFCADFSKPLNFYFQACIAAMFLASYAKKTGNQEALKYVDLLHALVKNGNKDHMFEDPRTIQICKYGWFLGVYVLNYPEKKEECKDDLIRKAHWFADCQLEDGAWGTSVYMAPVSSNIQKMTKTAEHLMQTCAVIAGLGSY